MEDILKKLTDKDDKAAYEFAMHICAESAKSDKYLEMIPMFAELLQGKSSFVRTRAFVLICSQARWANSGQIESVFGKMLPLLNDPKPTLVRQCLNALHEVVKFRTELSEAIGKALEEIDLAKYSDSMRPLIEKDIAEILCVE